MNTNFKIIGLTQLEIKPESTAPETDAITTQPSELLKVYLISAEMGIYCNNLSTIVSGENFLLIIIIT